MCNRIKVRGGEGIAKIHHVRPGWSLCLRKEKEEEEEGGRGYNSEKEKRKEENEVIFFFFNFDSSFELRSYDKYRDSSVIDHTEMLSGNGVHGRSILWRIFLFEWNFWKNSLLGEKWWKSVNGRRGCETCLAFFERNFVNEVITIR